MIGAGFARALLSLSGHFRFSLTGGAFGAEGLQLQFQHAKQPKRLLADPLENYTTACLTRRAKGSPRLLLVASDRVRQKRFILNPATLGEDNLHFHTARVAVRSYLKQNLNQEESVPVCCLGWLQGWVYAFNFEANVFIFELFLGDFLISTLTLQFDSRKINDSTLLRNAPAGVI